MKNKFIGALIILMLINFVSIAQQTNDLNSTRLTSDFACDDPCEINQFQLFNKDKGKAAIHAKKVVVGKRVRYGAKHIPANIVDIDFGDGTAPLNSDKWQLGPDTPNTWPSPSGRNRKISGIASIPVNTSPTDNNDFGLSYDNVRIFDINLNVNEVVCEEDEHFVFFAKDDNNIHDPTVPNWFYYWSQIPPIQDLLVIPNMTFWKPFDPLNPTDPDACSWVAADPTDPNDTYTLSLVYRGDWGFTTDPLVPVQYGETNYSVQSMEKDDIIQNFTASPTTPDPRNCGFPTTNLDVVAIGYGGNDFHIEIGQGCGFYKTLANNSEIDGIYCFYSTVVHEREHALIELELWGGGYLIGNGINVDGSRTSLDIDNDGYPDAWELTQNNFTVSANPNIAPFDEYGVNTNDGTDLEYSNLDLQTNPLYSAGTVYEEVRCRDKEVAASANHESLLDHLDWSFDDGATFNVLNQGKQWKKEDN